MDLDKTALLGSVNTLIASPDAHELFDKLNAVAAIATSVPVALTNGAAVLNPLLQLRTRNMEAFDRVVRMIEAKREALGYDRLVQVTRVYAYDKTSYMREFMDQKRTRQRKAADIENMLRPTRDRLLGNARLEFMRRQSAKWKELRDERLEFARVEGGGALTAAQRKQVLDEFWKQVDIDLDYRMARARVGNNPAPESDIVDLLAALNLPPR